MTESAPATVAEEQPPKQPAFEWWMLSNFAVGAGFAAFVALLIPPYVTEVTGSATWLARRAIHAASCEASSRE